MSVSKYSRKFKQRFRDRKRIIHKPGAEEESGKWIKCYVCGFPINLDKLKLTDKSGDVYSDFFEPDLNITGSGDALRAIPVLDSIDDIGVVLETGPDGNPITKYDTPRTMDPKSGCPFCSSVNF